jgi:hypothetical protein
MKKRMNIPDELKRFSDPGPATSGDDNGQEEGAGEGDVAGEGSEG